MLSIIDLTVAFYNTTCLLVYTHNTDVTYILLYLILLKTLSCVQTVDQAITVIKWARRIVWIIARLLFNKLWFTKYEKLYCNVH